MCWWEGSTSPRWRVSGSVSAASSGSEKKRDTVLLTVAQTTTWCERRAAEEDVPERGRWREAAREHKGLIVGREGKGKQGKKTGNITSG